MANYYSKARIMSLPDGLHKVERGLFLRVHGNRRSWQYIYTFKGKQFRFGLGSAATINLQYAKHLRDQALALVLSGVNPIEAKKAAKGPAPQTSDRVTFREYWERNFERIAAVKNWTSARVKMQWRNTIETYAMPAIGEVEVRMLTRADILRCIEPIWWTKAETASKVRMRLETILNIAVAEGYLLTNPATWKGNLDIFLPSKSKVHEVTHFQALHHTELKSRISRLQPSEYISHALIVFTILTACRIGETAPAKWSEIDWDERVWSVPPERRKDHKKYPHRVPLSTQALQLLCGLDRRSEYIFPAKPIETRGSGHVAKGTPRVILQKLFKDKTTMHGMRSTFRSWAAEMGVRDAVAEKCLMHSTGSDVVKAYQRSDLLDARRGVMQAWSDYLLG